mgnify:FL=1
MVWDNETLEVAISVQTAEKDKSNCVKFTVEGEVESVVHSAESLPVIAELISPTTVHRRHTCDKCNMNPIVGPRFRSKTMFDYDLCLGCMLAQPLHSRTTFTVIKGESERFRRHAPTPIVSFRSEVEKRDARSRHGQRRAHEHVRRRAQDGPPPPPPPTPHLHPHGQPPPPSPPAAPPTAHHISPPTPELNSGRRPCRRRSPPLRSHFSGASGIQGLALAVNELVPHFLTPAAVTAKSEEDAMKMMMDEAINRSLKESKRCVMQEVKNGNGRIQARARNAYISSRDTRSALMDAIASGVQLQKTQEVVRAPSRKRVHSNDLLTEIRAACRKREITSRAKLCVDAVVGSGEMKALNVKKIAETAVADIVAGGKTAASDEEEWERVDSTD